MPFSRPGLVLVKREGATGRHWITQAKYEADPGAYELWKPVEAKGVSEVAPLAGAGEAVQMDAGDPPAEPIRQGLGTDSGDQFSDDELRKIIEQETGEKVHHKTGREKLVARFNELNAAASEG